MSPAFLSSRRMCLATALLAGAAAALTACSSNAQSDSAAGAGGGSCANPITQLTIPYLGSTTGPATGYAPDISIPPQLVVDELSKSLGPSLPKIMIDQLDSQLSPPQAVTNYRQITGKYPDTPIIIGSLTPDSAPVAPLANRAQIPFVVALSSDITLSTKNRPWVFNSTPDTAQVVKEGASRWLAAVKNVNSVSHIENSSDAAEIPQGQAAMDAVHAAGKTVQPTVTFQTGETNFTSIVHKALSGAPDAVVVGGLPADAAAIVQELRRESPNIGIYLLQCAIGSGFYKTVGSAADGAYTATTFFADDPNPAVQSYTKAFEAKSGGLAPSFALGYNGWKLALTALANAHIQCMSAKDARVAVQKALTTVQVDGVDGNKIGFNADGYIASEPPVLLQIQGGVLKKVESGR